jgi:hypothetical protein
MTADNDNPRPAPQTDRERITADLDAGRGLAALSKSPGDPCARAARKYIQRALERLG